VSAQGKPDTITADVVARVRRKTGIPVLQCKRYLEQLPPADYAKFMAAIDSQDGRFLHDPIEDDPAYANIFEEIAREAKALIDQQIQERQRELRASGMEHMEWMARRLSRYLAHDAAVASGASRYRVAHARTDESRSLF